MQVRWADPFLVTRPEEAYDDVGSFEGQHGQPVSPKP